MSFYNCDRNYNEMHHNLHGSADVVTPAPVRSQSLTLTTANSVVSPIAGDNPVMSTALQVLDQLSDVGKALPFVAPAFVLLKIIIDMEKRASDVDAKCDDLVDRITFMLSHLPILLKIEVMASTRKVIDRINDTMKDAAALIAAYRKQNRVARRLSISNREKFSTCVDSVNACCRDLLMSLQIHQSVQLDILTRGVPMDEDDAAAETFVAEHGGSVDAVMHDRELVKEFAQQQHLVMDDSVMEQLNANIADTVQQNHIRLEGILRENVQASIVDGLKNLAAEMLSAEAEQKFVCIQCDKEFTNYTNGPKACSFHRAEYDSWSKSFPCCSTAHPCEFGAHRAKHHCDYAYGKFFPRSRGVLNYVDTTENWASVEDTNLENDSVQKASVSKLIRWVSRGARLEENTLLITVGRVWYADRYYFNTFTAQELQEITKSVRLSRRTLIFRTSSDENEYALAEWILSISGKITGVRITAKSTTSPHPFVRVCPIDLSTCTKSGEILTLSEGGMRSYAPSAPYILPEPIRIGPVLSDDGPRPLRTNFKTRTTPALRVILKAMSDPPLAANPEFANPKSDYYRGTVSVFNNNAAGSLNPVTIAGVSAEYRMVGDLEYAPVEACTVLGSDSKLPVTIEPRQSWNLSFEVLVPRTEEDAKLDIRWWNRSFGARYRPVRIKLNLEDIEGEQCSLVLEHVFTPYPFEKRKENDLAFFFYDDPVSFSRRYIHISPSDTANDVISIDGTQINMKKLEKAVYQALKTGKTEIDLGIGRQPSGGEWEWSAYALVDISCRRVYAFKLLLHDGKNASSQRFGFVGYVLCPSYGEPIEKTRPISYATEIGKLPPLEPYTLPEYVQDDTVDDFKPPVPPKPTTPIVTNGLNGPSIPNESIPVDLNVRLASIDTNLARIAEALEKLVSVLPVAK
ncbi:hypothetical protein BDN70DRAFT_831307 [Pholiota conissans]|uniref:Uncharacterized protein n=1 Tax=Pholiota conissans TaxID=109636 RepID=A0A9P6D360_9AGAR|nr:hypothetical protein BDN70DRAFT_831307 [Pholiota conissans]